MGHLHLSLLGAPRFRHGDTAVDFATRKTLALLVYLAVEGGMHSREKLAAILWPEKDAGRGRTNLRNTLVHLRRPLRHENQPSHLVIERNALGFNPDAPFTCDWHVLQDAMGTNDATILQTVVGRYRGDFLDGFSLGDAPAFAEWATLRREQAHRQMDAVFDRLSRMQAEAGDTRAAVAAAEQWLAHNPLNEAAARRLMRLHLANGDAPVAQAVYEQCRATLALELDVEPSPETEALAERMRKAEGGRRKAQAPFHSAFRIPQSEIPLIGRAAEHQQLVAAFHAAQQNRPGVVVLSGEAGVGKTRLAAEFLDWAAAHGGDVLRGRAFESGGRLPYQPIVGALRPRLDAENAPEDLLGDAWLTELSRLLPELRDRYPDLPPPAGGERAARVRLFEAVARLGESLARRAPLILFVDDVQWADAATLDLLHYAAGRWAESEAPVLLLLARRVEEPGLGGWLAGLARETTLARLPLEALTRRDTLALVRALVLEETPETSVTAFAGWLYAETGGQPFYVSEMLAALLEQEWLAIGGAEEERLDLAATVAEEGQIHDELRGFLPPGVHKVIRARLSRLGEEAFTLAAAGAVLGQAFSFARPCRLAGRAERGALAALDELLAARVWQETGESRRPYSFAHDKIRDVVYTEAGAARRRLFHREALALLEDEGAAAAMLAHHAERARLGETAVRYQIKAGDAAMDLFAVRDAAGYYEGARQTLAEQAGIQLPSGLRRHLYERLGRAYDILGELAEAEAVYQDLVELARREDDPAGEALALNRLATIKAYRHEPDVALDLLNDALPLAEASGEARARAETHWNMAQMALYGGDMTKMEPHATQALQLAREDGDPELIARCLNSLAYNARNQARPEEAIRYGEEARERYAALGDLALESDCLGVLAQAHVMAGRPETAVRHARQALAISREIESAHGVGLNLSTLIIALVDGGHAGEAMALVETFLAEMGEREGAYEQLVVYLVTSFPYRALLDAERVLATAGEGLAVAAQWDEDIPFKMDKLLALDAAEAHALRGEWAEAARYARQAPPLAGVWLILMGQYRWWLYGEAFLRAGDEAAVEKIAAQLEEVAGVARRYALPHHRIQAVLAEWEGDMVEAGRHLETAVSLAEEMGLPGERWQALAALAEVREREGDGETAVALRRKARQSIEFIAETIGDRALRERFVRESIG